MGGGVAGERARRLGDVRKVREKGDGWRGQKKGGRKGKRAGREG